MICDPVAATWSGRTPLIVPCVPTGINAGVSNTPCRVVTLPRRARVALSVFNRSKVRADITHAAGWYTLSEAMTIGVTLDVGGRQMGILRITLLVLLALVTAGAEAQATARAAAD